MNEILENPQEIKSQTQQITYSHLPWSLRDHKFPDYPDQIGERVSFPISGSFGAKDDAGYAHFQKQLIQQAWTMRVDDT